MMPRRPSARWALAAISWGLAFGGLSAAWAAGSTIGVSRLAPVLQEEAATRSTSFIWLLWVTALLKALVGLVAVAAVVPSVPRIIGHLARFGCWLLGLGFGLYGLGDTVFGAIRAANGDGNNAFWYAVLWGPIWLIGGITFLATAWFADREQP